MVEGHSVHRVATLHRQRLVGKAFEATSPNGRFAEGAEAIHGKILTRVEAVGKNLFAFFGRGDGDDGDDDNTTSKKNEIVVVHVHFGMAGAWAVYIGDDEDEAPPEPTKTNRLRLVNKLHQITADLSAMTVKYGGMELYESKKAELGHDPLRSDADPEMLWSRVTSSKKSIGALIMDQSYFTGPGNIYRAEILFKAGVHPDIPGNELTREQFDAVWFHTVSLLRRGYETGSILTVDPEEAQQLGIPNLRRYIYNTSHCPRCKTGIQTWTIASRTCYACPTCQPRSATAPVTPKKHCAPFNSHCARESSAKRLADGGPSRLTVSEIKLELSKWGIMTVPKGSKKSELVHFLEEAKKVAVVTPQKMVVSSEDAAAEKAAANESLAVEHIAELGPRQARRARAKVNPEANGGGLTVRKAKAERTESGIAAAVREGLREIRAAPPGGTPTQNVAVATPQEGIAASREGAAAAPVTGTPETTIFVSSSADAAASEMAVAIEGSLPVQQQRRRRRQQQPVTEPARPRRQGRCDRAKINPEKNHESPRKRQKR